MCRATCGPQAGLELVDRLSGEAALTRFDRDVLGTAGVAHLVVLLGINDIGAPGTPSNPADQPLTVEHLIAGYRELIARAHATGLRIYGGTITPFEGTHHPGFFTPDKELIRQAANHWIRTANEFDGVIDFDLALRDPVHPTRLLRAFDSGDHFHPNDLGMQAMANAFPLELFRDFDQCTGVVRRPHARQGLPARHSQENKQ